MQSPEVNEMRLPKKDVELFYKLYHQLLAYANAKYHLLDIESPEDIRRSIPAGLDSLRKKVYEHPKIINEFITKNPYNLTSSELKIVEEWNRFVKGEFIILRHLKNYTLFLELEEPPKAYGVLALCSPFDELTHPPPVMVWTVLLPFKGKIIYDGLLFARNVLFGSGYRESFNDTYQEAKFRFGIIESLPFQEERKKSDEDILRFYLKNERNREIYWEEIEKLIKDPRLLVVYHQEMGKVASREAKKLLRKVGLSRGWFAILEGMPVASGVTKDAVTNVVRDIVPEERWEFVYYFQLK
jgi:hypothetical protein